MDETVDGRFWLMTSGCKVNPFGGDVRSRLINTTLIFAAQCWGHVALKDTADMAVYNSCYTYLGEWTTGLNEYRKMTSYAYSRARRFFRYLAVEGTVVEQGSEILLVRHEVVVCGGGWL